MTVPAGGIGREIYFRQEPSPNAVDYRPFFNELILGDNTILAELAPIPK